MTAPDENSAGNGNGNGTVDKCDRVDTPNPNDVLCGRGGNINSHRGNEQFRSFVEKRKRVYLTARFKREKRLIASSIVNEIRAMDPPGRFLARKGSMKNNSGYWYDIGDEKARDKTSQALRENAPSIRAEIETEINQQRAEMRRQETTVEKPPSSASNGGKDSSYPPPPIGHHPPNNHPGVHHAQQHGHPPPPHMPHSYNHAHQSHYTQQYYDYYYHYYGYAAPPPPPPPGYTSSGVPPAPPPGYPPAPAPYWSSQPSQPNPNDTTTTPNNSTPPATTSSSAHPPHPIASISSGAATASRSPSTQGPQELPPHASASRTQTVHSPSIAMHNQEEEDRRMAMALQQEENAKAFEDRNRRYGSDRRSSRSTAFCAPGYRPRLLNDNIVKNNSLFPKKKRPAMSASSHLFGTPVSIHKESTSNSNISLDRIQNEESTSPNNPDVGCNNDMDMVDQYEMDLKPEAMSMKQEENNGKSDAVISDGLENDTNHHDFSCSSFSSRGRLHFKDDSDIMSLFGEGDAIIPPSNGNSTASFSRIRNMMASGNSSKNTDGNHSFNPISLEEEGEINHRHQESLQETESSRNHQNSNGHSHPEQNQDSSLLSQVAHHILGNFGVGGGWKGTASAASDRNSLDKQGNSHHQGGRMGPAMEMEEGQEVIMDVRDESSSMPPPHARGTGTQIDWASRAGCHTWIPDSIGYNTASSSHYDHEDNNRDQHGNHDSSLLHGNEHSLTHDTSYIRTDISPINSMDMDFSHSSLHGRQRSGGSNVGRGPHTSSSLMNVFDKKNDDLNSEGLLPQVNPSSLHPLPSWDRQYRSRSPVSIGDLSPTNGMDDSLIRVKKDKHFGFGGNNMAASAEHEDRHQTRQDHHPQSPIKLSSMRSSNQHMHQEHPSQNLNEARGVGMDWD